MIRWLTNDWGLKLVSFVLAVGLWYYAVGEESVEVKRTIPLEVTLQNPKMSILKSSAKNLQVTLIAQRALLSDMTAETIHAVHEIGNEVKSSGEYSFRVEPQEVKVPNPQIRVLQIEPGVINVTVDEVLVKKLEVKPDFDGEPAFGYKLSKDEVQLDPNAILMEGPKGELEKIDFIKTEKIDLVGRIRSFRRTVELDIPHNIKPLSEALIDVFIPIKEEFEEKAFENILVKILQSGDLDSNKKFEIVPPKVSFVLKGSTKSLQKMVPESILAYVDVAAFNTGEHQTPVTVVLPEDVQLKTENLGVTVIVNKK